MYAMPICIAKCLALKIRRELDDFLKNQALCMSQKYYKNRKYVLLISRMIYWKTRHSPDTPTERIVPSVITHDKGNQAKEDQHGYEKTVWMQLHPCQEKTSGSGLLIKYEKSFKF